MVSIFSLHAQSLLSSLNFWQFSASEILMHIVFSKKKIQNACPFLNVKLMKKMNRNYLFDYGYAFLKL